MNHADAGVTLSPYIRDLTIGRSQATKASTTTKVALPLAFFLFAERQVLPPHKTVGLLTLAFCPVDSNWTGSAAPSCAFVSDRERNSGLRHELLY
jgi:hypothetical protein